MSKDTPRDIPVLKEVIKRGDDRIIKTAKLEKEIFAELDMLTPPQQKPVPSASNSAETPTELKSGPLSDAIENIIEHHNRAMRHEIAQLLEDRLGLRP